MNNTAPSNNILEVEHLQAFIAGQQVVEDVSFSVPANGVTAILGRNGVGKTSTLKGILGLLSRKGEVTFKGERIDHLPTYKIVQRGVGYVPEDREVFSKLTVDENIRLAERKGGTFNRELVEALFPDLVQRSQQMAGTLSGGQQQMVSLARALINNNEILLVDEPTKGLAPKIVSEVSAALVEASKLTPILLVEQNLEVVRQLAERVIIISSGRVVHTGDAKAFLNDEAQIQRFLGVHIEKEA
ncbi:MAG: ABC transporter ATP-binding protein [Microbacteriaceae bacterium]